MHSESPQATGFRPAWPLLLSGPGAHVLAGSQTRSPAGGSLSRSSRGGGGSQRPGSPAGPPSPGSGCRGTQVGVAAARPPPGRPQLYHWIFYERSLHTHKYYRSVPRNGKRNQERCARWQEGNGVALKGTTQDYIVWQEEAFTFWNQSREPCDCSWPHCVLYQSPNVYWSM